MRSLNSSCACSSANRPPTIAADIIGSVGVRRLAIAKETKAREEGFKDGGDNNPTDSHGRNNHDDEGFGSLVHVTTG